MQRFLFTFLFLIGAIFLFSCEKEDVPAKATIVIDKQHIQVGEEVTIKAAGGKGIYHEWDLGNGVKSYNPVNTVKYDKPGKYFIRLKTTDPNKQTTETSLTLIVGEIYFEGININNFNFRDPDGNPWDSDGTGPDLWFSFDTLEGPKTIFGYSNLTQNRFPITLDYNYYNSPGPGSKIESKMLSIKIEEHSPQGIRPVKTWVINPAELLQSESYTSVMYSNNFIHYFYILPGNYPQVIVRLSLR